MRAYDPDLASPEFKAAPFDYYAHLRRAAPVREVVLRTGARAWLITRYDDATSVLSNPLFAKDPSRARAEAGGKPPWLPGPLRALSRNMLDVDEPDHRRLRTLVQKAFTPRTVEDLRPRIEEIAAELLRSIERRSTGADLIADYAAPLPVIVIAELLGVPVADRKRFRRWSEHIVAADSSMWRKVRALPAGLAFILFLRRLIRQRSAAPGVDLLSRLIEVHEAGDRLTADELLAMSFLLLVAGHETTVNLIGNGLLALLEHPVEMQRLRGDPARIPAAVEEMLRYYSPLQMATERYATAPVDVGGVTIPQGALVYVVLAAANRDEHAFANPEAFDGTRTRTALGGLTDADAVYPHTVGEVVRQIARGRGQAIVMLGLLLLIATPAARVAFSIIAFALERDRLYVVITAIVLILLLVSFAIGAAE